jgi:ATP-dependent helicase HrpB
LLVRLSAIDTSGDNTDTGRAMLRLPLHPRLARVVIEAERRGAGADGITAAALLGERDIRLATRMRAGAHVRKSDMATDRSDVLAMMDALYEGHDVDRNAVRRVDLARKQIRRLVTITDGKGGDDALLVALLAGYTDRVARRLSGRSLALAGGKAELAETSVVRDAPLMIAIDAEQRGTSVLVRIASEVTPEQLVEMAPDRLDEQTTTEWNASSERAERVTRLRFDGLAIEETRKAAHGDEASELLFRAALEKGPRSFAGDDLDALRMRLAFAHTVDPAIAELDDESLKRALRACCEGRASFTELRQAHVADLVRASVDQVALDRIAPARVTLPSGRSAAIAYEPGKDPYIASRLQDFFGLRESPRIGGGRVALVLHLLAPNQRAVQVTSDLSGFWDRHYPKIRKELMRKYPRHAWPIDPHQR